MELLVPRYQGRRGLYSLFVDSGIPLQIKAGLPESKSDGALEVRCSCRGGRRSGTALVYGLVVVLTLFLQEGWSSSCQRCVLRSAQEVGGFHVAPFQTVFQGVIEAFSGGGLCSCAFEPALQRKVALECSHLPSWLHSLINSVWTSAVWPRWRMNLPYPRLPRWRSCPTIRCPE